MQWILARLREDSTRAAIGQLALLVVLVAVALGMDIEGALSQAEAYTARVVALAGALAMAGVQVQRILTPDPAPPGAEAVLKATEILRETVGRR